MSIFPIALPTPRFSRRQIFMIIIIVTALHAGGAGRRYERIAVALSANGYIPRNIYDIARRQLITARGFRASLFILRILFQTNPL